MFHVHFIQEAIGSVGLTPFLLTHENLILLFMIVAPLFSFVLIHNLVIILTVLLLERITQDSFS